MSEAGVGGDGDLVLASIQRHPQLADRCNAVDHAGQPAEIGQLIQLASDARIVASSLKSGRFLYAGFTVLRAVVLVLII